MNSKKLFQLGTSIGLAVTSTIANTVSQKYLKHHPDLTLTDPAVLLVGFRAAGWVCFSVLVISIIIALVGLRGVGLVGQVCSLPPADKEKREGDIELAVVRQLNDIVDPSSSTANQSTTSIATAVVTNFQEVKDI